MAPSPPSTCGSTAATRVSTGADLPRPAPGHLHPARWRPDPPAVRPARWPPIWTCRARRWSRRCCSSIEEGYLTARERSGTFVAQELPAERIAAAARRRRQTSPRRPAVATRRGSGLARPPRRQRRAAAARVSPVAPGARRVPGARVEPHPVAPGRAGQRRAARLRAGVAGAARGRRRAGLVRPRHAGCSAEQVLLFGGGQRALEFAAPRVLDPGQRAWMEDPGYPGARQVLLAAGASVADVPVDGEGMSSPRARRAPAARAWSTPRPPASSRSG